MRVKVRRRTDTNVQPLDLALSAAGGIAALYAGAMSLGSSVNGQFFALLVGVGTLISFFVVLLLGHTKFVHVDGILYTAGAVVAAVFTTGLSSILPENIYTGPLLAPGLLSWMIVLGSVSIWRDQTLLFQAIPAIALFGLVGCYDTFPAAVLYFFLFLLCQAFLLARAHGRAMLQQAKWSGARDSLEISAMRKGPWRWMAGPEWALASAFAVVMLSLVGAPFLREQAKAISGLVHYVAPTVVRPGPSVTSFTNSGTRVGNGPNRVSSDPLFLLKIDQPRYLRASVWGKYISGQWYPRVAAPPNARTQPQGNYVLDNMTVTRTIEFQIEPIDMRSPIVPAPGETTTIDSDSGLYYTRTNTFSYSLRRWERPPPYPTLEGRATVAAPQVQIRDAQPGIGRLMPDYLDTSGTPPEVTALARQATKDATTDFEKALAIKGTIEERAKYNLNAAATPAGKDPVEYFLFESNEGYCDLFASSMVLMARAVGLPARYVTGYYPFIDKVDGEGRYTIRENDAHAWCEIFFKNAGWVVFDATEGAEAVDGGGRGSDNATPFWLQPWFLITIGAPFVAVSGLVLYRRLRSFAAYRRSPNYARNRKRATLAKQRMRVGREAAAFEHRLRRVLRRPRRLGETIQEYAAAAGSKLGDHGADAVGWSIARALYAVETPDGDVISSLRAEVRQWARNLERRK